MPRPTISTDELYCSGCHALAEPNEPFCEKCGADRPAAGWGPDTLPGTIVAGKYRLEERLGSGGMGYVYRVKHVDLGTDFALKFLHRDLTTIVHKKRFTREARIAAALTDPHTVQVIDFGAADEQLYLVMEYIAGPNLSDHVAARGRPSVRFVVEMLRQIASALEEAHEQGNVHRDIKPENILIAPARRGLLFKLTDFGIASMASQGNERLTSTGMVHGSPGYMSPEQASGNRNLDGRADLYGLGVIAWELLANRPIFEASTAMEVIVKHIREEPDSLRTLRPPPGVPTAVHDAIEGLLCKDRNDRFANAGALLAALSGVDSSTLHDPGPVDAATHIPERKTTTAPTTNPKLLAATVGSESKLTPRSAVPEPSKTRRLSAMKRPLAKVGETAQIQTLASEPHPYKPVGNPIRTSGEIENPVASTRQMRPSRPASRPTPPPEPVNLNAASETTDVIKPLRPNVPTELAPVLNERQSGRRVPGFALGPQEDTSRIETLSVTPYGYDPVGNPSIGDPKHTNKSKSARHRKAHSQASPTLNVALDQTASSDVQTPATSFDDDKIAAVKTTPEGAEMTSNPAAIALSGESLGDVDDIYEKQLSHRHSALFLAVLAGVIAAGVVWMFLHG